MSDHDPAPDPMDKAYAQAEAVLDDEAARAARRSRVLAAVASEAATSPAAEPVPVRRPAWRHGGWLVAASVAGLSILLTTHIYAPPPVGKPPTPQAAAPVAETREAAAPETAVVDAAAPPPRSADAPAQTPRPEPEARAAAPRQAPPAPFALPPAPPPPPLPPMSVPLAPAPPPAAAPSSLGEVAVTAQRREDARVEEVIVPTARMARPSADHAGAPAPGRSRMAKSAAPSDDAARLHAAAASGRTAELSDLLAGGVPVDALDADGETALMKSIQADQPAAAAVLRHHGASLDRRNRDGESARDMAKAADDAELDEALGLDR